MGLYEKCRTDPALESGGVVFNYPDLGFRVTGRRAGGANKGFNKALTRLTKDFKRAMDLDLVDNETLAPIMHEVYADEIIVPGTWETKVGDSYVAGIENESGEIVPQTRENVIATFKALPIVFERIQEDANRQASYLASMREARSGNS